MPSEFKSGTCQWCGEKGPVYRDNGRCEDCDRNVRHCSVCREDYHRDNHCRHIFEDRWLEWHGSGIGVPDDGIKDAFLKLAGLMPSEFAEELRAAIRSGGFYTWSVMPLIGGGGLLELNGMPCRGYKWGEHLMEIGGGDDAEETADGYRWLVSLYERKTRDANKITLAWLAELIEGREDAMALARLADDGCGQIQEARRSR